jgi:hypothetical protein
VPAISANIINSPVSLDTNFTNIEDSSIAPRPACQTADPSCRMCRGSDGHGCTY